VRIYFLYLKNICVIAFINRNVKSMKSKLLLALMMSLATIAFCQENMVTLSGGYAFANVEDADENATGFRINGLYEFNPGGGNWAYGISVGYIRTTADVDILQSQSKYTISSWPIYFAPKFLFGKASAKGFVKGALGWQWSGIDRTGPALQVDRNDSGFYAGAGVGFMKTFNEKFFINLEYEWAYMANAYYREGMMNSIMGGIGMKF
jgi:hypothetical protein